MQRNDADASVSGGIADRDDIGRSSIGAAAPNVGNDNLALALQRLSRNSRDREQFVGTRARAAT